VHLAAAVPQACKPAAASVNAVPINDKKPAHHASSGVVNTQLLYFHAHYN
jgi:hypothetical protein